MLLFPESTRRTLVPYLVSYAAGTLLGAAFLGMIPAGLEQAPATTIMATVLAGMVLFFVLEKLVLWRHSHEAAGAEDGRAGPLILIGDAFHNFVDGVVIAAAFLTSIPLGVAAALAVIAHEVPQEVGDFAILLDSGYGRMKALVLNGLSATTTLPGAVLAYFWLGETRGRCPTSSRFPRRASSTSPPPTSFRACTGRRAPPRRCASWCCCSRGSARSRSFASDVDPWTRSPKLKSARSTRRSTTSTVRGPPTIRSLPTSATCHLSAISAVPRRATSRRFAHCSVAMGFRYP